MRPLVRRLAKHKKVSKAAAADELDRVIHDVLTRLRRGERVRIPGLGVFAGSKPAQFEAEANGERAAR
jgi:nucleoid DNA-binding protein